jgi:transcriptional regulator with XRE-family HTH domain
MPQTRLKQLREEAVLTVHELAEASGVSDDTISKIENGQRIARPSTLRKLAQALVVSPQELRKPAAAEEVALAGKAEAPPVGAVPNSLEDLLKSRGVRTRHLADEGLRGKLAGLPLEAAVQTVREVGAEMEAIAPDLAHLFDQHLNNPRATRLYSEAVNQLFIARYSLYDRQGQKFVPEVDQTRQALDRAELALAGTG